MASPSLLSGMPKREYPDAPFPVERLKIVGATLSAQAHKNDYTALHVDWVFTISFKPLIVIGRECASNVMIQIETPTARRMEDFAGMKRRDTEKDFNIGSFYLFDHRPSVDTRFRIHSVKRNKLDVEVSIKADLGDSYADPDPPMSLLKVRTAVKFQGFGISSSSVQCSKKREAVMKVAESLIDPARFGPPQVIEDAYRKRDVNLWYPAR
jgi:hypothetical protein